MTLQGLAVTLDESRNPQPITIIDLPSLLEGSSGRQRALSKNRIRESLSEDPRNIGELLTRYPEIKRPQDRRAVLKIITDSDRVREEVLASHMPRLLELLLMEEDSVSRGLITGLLVSRAESLPEAELLNLSEILCFGTEAGAKTSGRGRRGATLLRCVHKILLATGPRARDYLVRASTGMPPENRQRVADTIGCLARQEILAEPRGTANLHEGSSDGEIIERLSHLHPDIAKEGFELLNKRPPGEISDALRAVLRSFALGSYPAGLVSHDVEQFGPPSSLRGRALYTLARHRDRDAYECFRGVFSEPYDEHAIDIITAQRAVFRLLRETPDEVGEAVTILQRLLLEDDYTIPLNTARFIEKQFSRDDPDGKHKEVKERLAAVAEHLAVLGYQAKESKQTELRKAVSGAIRTIGTPAAEALVAKARVYKGLLIPQPGSVGEQEHQREVWAKVDALEWALKLLPRDAIEILFRELSGISNGRT